MDNNILNKLSVTITTEQIPALEKLLEGGLVTTDFVYSYLIYSQYKDKQLVGWLVEFLVSQTEGYNTISTEMAISTISRIIRKAKDDASVQYVVGYKQPPVEILVETFDPLVKKLAAKQREYWSIMEYEDLCQICRVTIIHLYNKGYYVHSKLISRAFTNEVLMQLRPQRYAPDIVSLDKSINAGYGDEITLLDKIVDKVAEEAKEDAILDEITKRIVKEKRKLIIEALGGSERQYDQLVREYGNKAASPWARMAVQRIKKYLAKININEKSFDYLKE